MNSLLSSKTTIIIINVIQLSSLLTSGYNIKMAAQLKAHVDEEATAGSKDSRVSLLEA